DGHWVRRSIDALQVPPAVRDSVLERLRRLGPDARAVCKAVAVVGVPAESGLLATVADLSFERTDNGLCEALGAAVLVEVEPATYGYRHTLAAEAVHSSIHRPELKRLHLRAAVALETQYPTPSARLAHHFREAGHSVRAAECDEAAGDLAVGLHDDAAAVHFFEQALQLAEVDSVTRARLAVKLGRSAQRSLTRHAEAATLLSSVLGDSSVGPCVQGELRHLLGGLLTLAGDASSGRAEQVASLPDLSEDPGLRALAMARLAQPGVAEGDIDEHLHWLSEAHEIAVAQDDPHVTLEVLAAQAVALVRVGDPRGQAVAAKLPKEARSKADRHALTSAAIGLAGGSFHLGHYERAYVLLTDARRRAAEVGSGPYVPALEGLSLLHLWAVGRWDGLEEEARRHASLNGHYPSWAVASLRVSGYLALARGDWDGAESDFAALFNRARVTGVIPATGGAAAGLAWLSLRRGDPDAALTASMRGLDLLARKRVWVWGAEIVPATVASLTTSGRSQAAADLVEQFAAGVRGRDAPLAKAALEWSRGMVARGQGRLDDAAEKLMGAAQRYGRLPRPYEEATTRAQAGELLLEAGDRQGAVQLRRALDGFQHLGASADAARLRLVLRRNSETVPTPWHGGRRGYGQALSPREREVSELVAQGHTNSAIAKLLYLSPRTIEHHVGSVMRKLGVRSRTELAARWASADDR
nr:LuxR C-terminal-related transcriptional regulator [Actinomycetota bacterium]